jgi:hypothetical protein
MKRIAPAQRGSANVARSAGTFTALKEKQEISMRLKRYFDNKSYRPTGTPSGWRGIFYCIGNILPKQ